MRLSLVGHASVLLEHEGVSLLTDPWLRGSAFDDGWRPWPEPVLRPEQLDAVTHLWVSHEHPDHLSVPTLRALPEERRRAITVLYQRSWSPEVVRFLRTLGFADVVELPHGAEHRLAPGVAVRLFQVGHEDAALAVRAGGRTVLDLNDCKPSEAGLARLRRAAGPVDVLLTQYSIAGWPGNRDDPGRRARSTQRAIDAFRRDVDGIRPATVVPFASAVRFGHVDNAYANDAVVPLARVAEAVPTDRFAGLRPGDTWDLDGPWDGTEAAVAADDAARAAVGDQPLTTSDAVPFDDVVAGAVDRMGRLRAAYHRAVRARVPPVTFSLLDHGRALRVDVGARDDGVAEVAPDDGECRVEVASSAAGAAFTHRWGLPTLLISARLQVRGDERPFLRLKQLGAASGAGIVTRGVVADLDARRLDLLRRRWRDLVGNARALAG